MVEVCAVFCYCLLWLYPRYNRSMFVFVCCSDCERDVVFSVYIVRRGAVGAPVWEV